MAGTARRGRGVNPWFQSVRLAGARLVARGAAFLREDFGLAFGLGLSLAVKLFTEAFASFSLRMTSSTRLLELPM